MNALELADWIKDTEFYDNPNPEINDKMDEVEDMLRILDGQLAFRIDAVTKYQAKVEEQQAEIEKLRSWVEMLAEVPFFNEIDHYRGIPVAILRKAQE